MEFNLDTPLIDLRKQGRISVRTYNCLFNSGMKSLGDILNRIKTPKDLLDIRNFGRKSYGEIEPILCQMIKKQVATSPTVTDSLFAILTEQQAEIICDAYHTIIDGCGDSKAYLQVAYPHPLDLHNLVMGDVENMLIVVEDYSREANLEIRHTYKRFIESVLNGMREELQTVNDIYAIYKCKGMELAMKMDYFSREQVIRYFLSPTACDYLEMVYQEKKEKLLSTRGRNFAKQFVPHFSDLIKFADDPLSSYQRICPGQTMTQTLTELFQFNQIFKKDFDRISMFNDDEIRAECLIHDYPFLTSLDHKFVLDFAKEHSHAPLFFLLFQYLRISENKSNKIYCLYHGIIDGKRHTLNEIADKFGLTRERCRQILLGKIEAQESEIANNAGWKYYHEMFEMPFIYEKAGEFIRLKAEEHLPEDFNIFAALVCLKADFKMEYVDGHSILINNNVKGLVFSDCKDVLSSIVNAKYFVDTCLPLDSILQSAPEPLWTEMKTLISYIASDIYKVRVTEDGQLCLPQNDINIAAELYDILDRKGEPMHVKDIFEEFKRRYPDHKYSEPSKIRPWLYKHKHIRAVGKTSCYALDSWEGVYFGSIRDLLVDLLSSSDLPLHIDNLYDGVSKFYPNTTKSSVAATMEDESLRRFVEFKGCYFGLTSKQYPAEYVVAPMTKRFSFEDRFQMFKDFIDTNHRFPYYNGTELEATLVHWYYNVTKGILDISDEQKSMFDHTLRHYGELGYPRSVTEGEFKMKCEEVKEYIRRNHTLPSNTKAPELYAWLRRSRNNYASYTDKRRQYMEDLLDFILSFESFGF